MFAIPSLSDLFTRVVGAFRSEASLDASLPFNNVYPIAKVIAGHSSEIFGRMDYVGQQAFVLHADEYWLGEHAKQYNIPRKSAELATGSIDVISSSDISIPAGTVFTRVSDDAQYVSSIAVSLPSAGTAIVSVVAQETGEASNADAGDVMTFDAGVTGTGADTATASVATGGIIGGADLEDVEDWRGRILFRLRYTPHGGAPSDYVIWASAVAGVTRVFVERLYAGPGTVRIYPVFDDYFDGGVATSPYIDAVAAAISLEAPATAWISVAAPIAQFIDVTVTGLSPFTTPVQEAVRAELKDTFRRLGRVSGLDTDADGLPFLATPHTFSRSWIWQAIANATGEERHVLVAPTSDIVVAPGSIPVLGTVSLSA
jgi:uncharacterized phage protein gp47/JayE